MLDSNEFSINHQDENGNSFLHLCIEKNKFHSAIWLIKNTDIDLTLCNGQNQDALLLASQKNNHRIVEAILLTKKIDINKIDNENRTLLQNMTLSGNKETVRKFLKHDADINHKDNNNKNILFDAVDYGDEDFLKELLDVDNIDVHAIDIQGQTLLHKTGVLKSEDLCIKLLQKGLDPSICDQDGNSFLYHCASQGMEGSKLLEVALEYGGNINAKVNNNNSLLMESLKLFYKTPSGEKNRRESLLKMAETLVDKGLDINAINDDGENGLFDAIRNKSYDTCAFFTIKGVDINLQNIHGHTPLMVACEDGIESLDLVLLLLNYEADVTIVNNDNKTVLEVLNNYAMLARGFISDENTSLKENAVVEKEHISLLKEILVNIDFKTDILTSKEQPLFFEPLLYGDVTLFSVYVKNKFDINQVDKSGLNIFYIYVYTVFSKNKYFENFKNVLVAMIANNVNINFQDKEGQHVFSKVITKDTNIKLYNDLVEVCNFNYSLKDKRGRTVYHHCVLAPNIEILKFLLHENRDTINDADSYGIRPLMYAALMQSIDIVYVLLDMGNVYINSSSSIPAIIREKFKPMISKLDTLSEKTNDKDLLRKINILIAQIKKDFRIDT